MRPCKKNRMFNPYIANRPTQKPQPMGLIPDQPPSGKFTDSFAFAAVGGLVAIVLIYYSIRDPKRI